MKQFKSKRIRKRKFKFKYIFIFFFFFSYIFMINYCLKHKLKENVLNNGIDYINFNINKYAYNEFKKNINKPINMLNPTIKKISSVSAKKSNPSSNNEAKVMNNTPIVGASPILYLYNTHQSEKYDGYSVIDAALMLKEKLVQNNIPTYYEEQSISVFLQENNLQYYNSYKASKKYLSDAIIKYPSIKYFIDIHRDSISKEKSTIEYNKKNYARILFVIGSENPNQEKNKTNAEKLNSIIESKVKSISRGIVSHGGKGYNGVYNQDISENVFLIEIGGVDNNKNEVENTVDVLYESITEYLRSVI